VPKNTQTRLSSISEAAEYYDVNPKTIRRWIKSGHITGIRIGPKLLRVDLDELDALPRDRRADDKDLPDAKRDLAAETLAEHVARVIAQAPPLTDEQRTRIAALLRTGSGAR
jgi:excisionase family DNA binding protein